MICGSRTTGRAALAAAAAAALVAAASAAGAQTFGQFTTARISPLGEGSLFITGGSGRAGAGVAMRFQFSERGDAGLQLGYDRAEEVDSYGFGVDYKRYLISSEGTVPIDLAGVLSYGYLSGSGYSRSLFGLSVIISGIVPVEGPVGIEPYGSVGFAGRWFHDRGACEIDRPGSWPCREDEGSADSGLLLRGGAKIVLTGEFQTFVELTYDDTASIGIAFNVVF